jgi:hypothetical protein
LGQQDRVCFVPPRPRNSAALPFNGICSPLAL